MKSHTPDVSLRGADGVAEDGQLGHLTSPSDASDAANNRPPTEAEAEFYGQPEITAAYKRPPARGPLAGVDLVRYMRTGEKFYKKGAVVVRFPKPAPLPVASDTDDEAAS